jgi:hypothetical protein
MRTEFRTTYVDIWIWIAICDVYVVGRLASGRLLGRKSTCIYSRSDVLNVLIMVTIWCTCRAKEARNHRIIVFF